MRQVDSKARRTARIVNDRVITPDGTYYLWEDEIDDFLESVKTFYVEMLFDQALGFSARKEMRSGKAHWYAYKRVGGLLMKRYIGQHIDQKTLWDAASMMMLTGTSNYSLFNPNRKKV